ncbi:MAG: radical SAM family heme chaperone HemW [Parachlamydia sp.]|nr:radical SAM family heme chaperone HemW [Parachlamydia sp.]
MVNRSPFSLYFHIPFCSRKCDYCHFYVIPDRESDKQLLLTGFKREWLNWLPQLEGRQLVSVYFGGGTPSLFGPERIAEILGWIRAHHPAIEEVTLEANPERITAELMAAYREAGINRISIGLQTLDDALLHQLGRTHASQQGIDAVLATAQGGISNITVDLMYDIPTQTLASWERTLERLRTLPITHLSLYNLTFEPQTLFFKKRAQLLPTVPDPETSLQMYLKAIEYLESLGLQQYEISAFAKPGFHSRHNVGYWTARPFLGFGPSAYSYWEGSRFRNICHLRRYSEALEAGDSPADFSEKLDEIPARRELLTVQLRLVKGVDLLEFESRHGPLDPETKSVLHDLQKQDFLEQDNSILRLTPRGRLFYDSVAAELI